MSEEGEREGERSLKALPYVIDWFRRAEDAVDASNRAGYSGQIVEFKRSISELSSIYQFARAMPLLFEGIKSYDSTRTTSERELTPIEEYWKEQGATRGCSYDTKSKIYYVR